MMITAIEFSAFSNRFSIPEEYLNFLYGLKQINVFVGPNNSGKSIFFKNNPEIEIPEFENKLKELKLKICVPNGLR
jgi:predicted ATPase